MAVVYGITNFIETGNFVLVSGGKDVAAIMGLTPVAALAYLMFNLFTLPCIAALSTMNAEMKSKKWFLGGIAFQFCTGYTIAYFVYQIGTLVTTGSLGTGVIPGLFAILLMLGVVVFLTRNSHKNN